MTDILEYILKYKNISYAIFNSSYKLSAKSINFSKSLFLEDITDGEKLAELFPEFFGMEEELNKVLSGKKVNIKIDRVNRINLSGEVTYFNFLATKYNNSILVLISNSTNQSNLEQEIQQHINEIKILKENILHLKKDAFNNILGSSNEISIVKKFIKKIANIKETTILLTGESGTGKSLIARGIHNYSNNSDTPFVEINCAAIPSALLESELFGHVKGSFTTAVESKKGLLEEADGGTLFLDEIGELPIEIQPKLLSFLEAKKFRRIGSTKEISVNTRIIAATNKDLEKAVKEKEFREDLYYRINVAAIKIPSLRERPDDISILAKYFVEMFASNFNKSNVSITNRAVEKLIAYSWPGNIRELKNCIERAMIFTESDEISSEDILIPEIGLKQKKETEILFPNEGISLVEIEKKYLISAMNKSNGNQSKAAKLLNLSLDTFRYRIKKYKLSS